MFELTLAHSIHMFQPTLGIASGAFLSAVGLTRYIHLRPGLSQPYSSII